MSNRHPIWSNITRSARYKSLPIDSPLRVYMRIMEAAEKGKGVVISAEEAFNCSLDNAVEQACISAIEEDFE